MQDIVLNASSRTLKSKSFRASSEDIPGVVYGKTQEPLSISLPLNVLSKAYHQAGGNRVIDVLIDDAKKPIKALFHEVQTNPLTGDPSHFDLYAVTLGEKLRTEVPLHFVGEPPESIHRGEAILVTIRDEVEVEANPLDLPESIEVDISQLVEIGDSITVGDLKATGDAEIITEPDETVVKLDAPKEEEPEEELEEGAEGEATEGEAEDGDGASDTEESSENE